MIAGLFQYSFLGAQVFALVASLVTFLFTIEISDRYWKAGRPILSDHMRRNRKNRTYVRKYFRIWSAFAFGSALGIALFITLWALSPLKTHIIWQL